MVRFRWSIALAAASICLFLTGCPQGGTTGTATVFVSATPRTIANNGQSTQLSVLTTDAKGNAGTGSVSIAAAVGQLGDAGTATTTLTLDPTGTAKTTFACLNCTAGQVSITATWNSLTSTPANVTVTSNQVGGDGGSDAGAGDGGSDGGTGFGNGTALHLTFSRSPIFYGVGDHSDLTATLTQTDGGPIGGATLGFATTLGGFIPLVGAGTPQPTTSAITASDGTAVVRFTDTGTPGTATITATHAPSQANASVAIDISSVQQMSWVVTNCNGIACSIMGVKGSGSDQAQVEFKLVDTGGQPVEGVTVSFSINNPPLGTTVSPSGVSDANGHVIATISSGITRGVVTVHAIAIAGRVEADSDTIGIRGVKPTNKGFTLQCGPTNLGAYVSSQPPNIETSTCLFKLEDRYLNPIGTGTFVNFNSEAGGIPPLSQTVPYNPGNPSDPAEGTGTVVFSTQGVWPPPDVAPFPAAPTQFPFPRQAEPSMTVGAIVRNPRDGLVTILAYVGGEEWFDDANQNGKWDPGEQFIDQGEPFVDYNDNGVRDPGEPFIDLAPSDGGVGNGVWDPPNGVWDGNTTIWTETRVLYSSRPSPSTSAVVPSPFAGPCGSGTILTDGGVASIVARFADLNFNIPEASQSSFSGSYVGAGSFTFNPQTLLDGYGFGIERRLLDQSLNADCTPSSTICQWKVLFYNWSAGYTTPVATVTAPTPPALVCTDSTVTFQSTVFNGVLQLTSKGGVQ